MLVARAVALAESGEVDAALSQLEAITDAEAYQPWWAARARTLWLSGDEVAARVAASRAAGLSSDPGIGNSYCKVAIEVGLTRTFDGVAGSTFWSTTAINMSPTEATANGATVITTLGSRSPVPRPWSACRRRTLPRNSCASAGPRPTATTGSR